MFDLLKTHMDLVSAIVGGVVGGVVAHFSARQLDRTSRKREKKVDYLIEAYRRFETCANRENPDRSSLESAIADIQLFGSINQVNLALEIAEKFTRNGSVLLNELLEDLRRDLRTELKLKPVTEKLKYLRWPDPTSMRK